MFTTLVRKREKRAELRKGDVIQALLDIPYLGMR